jgi:hypothetical protein
MVLNAGEIDFSPAPELVMTIAPPSPRSSIAGKRRFNRVENAREQHVHRIDKRGHIVGPLPHARPDAGVGENEVHAPEFGDPVGDHGLHPVEVTDITLLGADTTPGLLDEVDGLVEVLARGHRIPHSVNLIAQIHCDDVGTFLGKPNRMGTPLTASSARNEGNLALELTCHDSPSEPTDDKWRADRTFASSIIAQRGRG